VLVQEVQRAAQDRSDLAARDNMLRGGFMFVLLVVLALVVVEPTARSVGRQHRALSRQALRLKRLALVAETSSNAIVIADEQRKVVWANATMTRLTGYTLEQVMGQRIGMVLGANTSDPATYADFERVIEQGQGLKREIKLLLANGRERLWLLVDVQPIYASPTDLTGWVFVATDLTELRSQQQLLTLAVEGAGLGTWQWDIGIGAMQCNDRMLEIMGYQRAQIGMTTQDWNGMLHPDDFPAWVASVTAHLRDPSVVHRMSVRLRHGSGRWVWILFAGTVVDRTPDGRGARMAGVAMDVQAQKAMEQQLRTAARTDGLTQLPNRTVVLDMIQAAIARGRAHPGYYFAVLFMDFDRFKQVNDTLGHSAGDELLRQIARRLQDSLRPGDSMMHTSDCAQLAARIGGDEFVVLLDDIRGDLEAEIVASRLLDVLSAPYAIGVHKVNSTVSIGIVTSSHAAEDADSVLRDADIAMYEAKRTGRARYCLFEPSMGQRLIASVALENDLRQALDKHELFVVYQPLVDLATGRVAGMEALMRWRHGQRGVVSPVEFIPVAEACGLIGPMGLFVLQTACTAFSSLQVVLGDLAPPTVAVNLSRAQLRQPGLAADVLDAVRDAGMSPQQLVLEVTESLAAQDELVLSTLHDIRALGVALSLDDFGTGYSSLSCLHELPVNFVKIDRSFVITAQSSEYHRVLIEATIRMAQALHLGTVAEGIETAEHAALMAQLGCHKGQGYLYSKPLEAQALVEWIQARADQTRMI
jgi:diguanylate cyclase (GGDEF)-like protein/PAS domain S-box-containing protein